MYANEFKLDVIANNMANAGTTAFKRSRPNFEDLYYRHLKLPGTRDLQGNLTAVGTSVGLGTKVESTQIDFQQGELLATGAPLDVAIVGDGFFTVTDGNQTLYTRAGNFSKNADGTLVMASANTGYYLIPQVTIPNDATEIAISNDGQVSVRVPNQQNLTQLAQLQMVRFVNPQGLLQMGQNCYAATDASGQPLTGNPGTNGLGTMQQGFLELSNVEPVKELVDLISTQRNFELNSQVVQAADQLLQATANLRRY